MLDKDTEICVCNSLTAEEIAKCIKENDLKSLEELLDNDDMPVGDTCELCRDEGFNNDGVNLPMVFSMVEKEMI